MILILSNLISIHIPCFVLINKICNYYFVPPSLFTLLSKFHYSFSIHFAHPFIQWGFIILIKIFKDLGLGMDLRSILNLHFPLIPFTFLIGCMPSPFFLLAACWLHRKYKRFILILNILWNPSTSTKKKWFTSEFVKAQTHMLILCYSTHPRLLVLGTYTILVFLEPITFYLSWHMYVSSSLSINCDSTPMYHLTLVSCSAPEVIGTWSSLNTWRSLDTCWNSSLAQVVP